VFSLLGIDEAAQREKFGSAGRAQVRRAAAWCIAFGSIVSARHGRYRLDPRRIAFPRPRRLVLLTDAEHRDEAQLRELHIRLRKPVEPAVAMQSNCKGPTQRRGAQRKMTASFSASLLSALSLHFFVMPDAAERNTNVPSRCWCGIHPRRKVLLLRRADHRSSAVDHRSMSGDEQPAKRRRASCVKKPVLRRRPPPSPTGSFRIAT